MLNIVFRLSFSKNILVSARIFWSKGAKICERLSLVPRLPLSLQTNGQSWYLFYAFRFSICQKNNLRMSRAVQLSQLSTPAFSTLLWKNSSHLRIRLTCTCFEDSSAWAWNPLLSRSTRAFVLIAYIRAKHAWTFMRALIRSIVCPYLCSSHSGQLRQVFTLLRVILRMFRYLWFLGTTCPFNIVTK